MSTISIPSWNAQGVIPPLDVLNPTSAARSPYRISLTDLVLPFNTSPERRAILDGLLRFRSALQRVGVVAGFQWLDGSFLEDIETLESRAPNDVDVVTFFRLPPGRTQTTLRALDPDLFDHDKVKAYFLVDSYFQGLGARGERLVRQSAYWYSMWSHRRSYAWKGYLEVALDPAHDSPARALLTPPAGGAP